jgi:alkylhydroperoxidase family enzyme
LPAEKVQALIAGLPTSFEDLRQQVIYEITQTLIAPRVLYVGKLSDCIYIWRQNVVVARSLGVTQEEIDALGEDDMCADCSGDAQKAAFRFAKEALELIEVSDEVYTETSRFFSPQAITELLYIVGTYMLLARIARTGRVPLDATPAAATSLK